MQPKTLGRALGIGARVAGRSLLAEKPPATPQAAAAAEQQRHARVRAAGERGRTLGTGLGQGTRNIGRGTRAFGRSVWNPFALAAGVLWLEITGLFFALFALFFAQHVYELRAAWRVGPEHSRFLLYAGLTMVFLYLCASSFVRAGRRQRAAEAGGR